MKKPITIYSRSIAIISIILFSVLLTSISSFAAATNYEISFNMSNANKSVFYDTTTNVLTASGISVDSVTSVNTPLNNGQTLSLINTVLNFTFDDNTNVGTISLTENQQTPVTIFSGYFADGSITQTGNKNSLKTAFTASYTNNIGQDLATYFGLPLTGEYQGSIGFTVNKSGNFTLDPKSLTSSTSVPIPGTGLLLAAGLIGLISVRRKQTT